VALPLATLWRRMPLLRAEKPWRSVLIFFSRYDHGHRYPVKDGHIAFRWFSALRRYRNNNTTLPISDVHLRLFGRAVLNYTPPRNISILVEFLRTHTSHSLNFSLAFPQRKESCTCDRFSFAGPLPNMSTAFCTLEEPRRGCRLEGPGSERRRICPNRGK
jgi:hypothetical protein